MRWGSSGGTKILLFEPSGLMLHRVLRKFQIWAQPARSQMEPWVFRVYLGTHHLHGGIKDWESACILPRALLGEFTERVWTLSPQ